MTTFTRVRVKPALRCYTIKQRAMVCNNFWKLKEEKGYWTSSNQFTVIRKADITDTEKKIVITNLLFDA